MNADTYTHAHIHYTKEIKVLLISGQDLYLHKTIINQTIYLQIKIISNPKYITNEASVYIKDYALKI